MTLRVNGDTVTFEATGLVDNDGFNGGLIPLKVEEQFISREGHGPTLSTWRNKVLLPVLDHLLLPTIPIPVTVHRPMNGVPFATHVGSDHIADQFGRSVGMLARLKGIVALQPYRTTVTLDGLYHLWLGWRPTTWAGVPPRLAAQALTAALPYEEVIAAHQSGPDGQNALRALVALRTDHPSDGNR